VLLTEVLAGQAMGVHSHETFGEYRARLIAGELASAKAREAVLRAENRSAKARTGKWRPNSGRDR
jgi:hypothetical protein